MHDFTKYSVDDHIRDILNFWTSKLPSKYKKGYEEHKTKLWEAHKINDEITGEIVDLLAYWVTYEQQVTQLLDACVKLEEKPDALRRAMEPFFTK